MAGQTGIPESKPRRPLRKSVLFHIATTLAVLLLAELGLRLSGFEYHNIPRYIQFADDKYRYPDRRKGHFDFVPDDRLFWRLTPDNPAFQTNSHGYRGAEFTEAKNPDVTRIIALGCSCTFGLRSPYSYTQALEQLLDGNRANKRYEVINAGVPGYTSFQGARLFDTELARYRPDLVTVYFGWNDHWLARYFQDKDQKSPSPAARTLLEAVSRVRLLQALLRLSGAIRGLARGNSPAALFRVSPEDYRANLRTIIRKAQAGGARVVLITSPAGFSQESEIPDGLVRDGFITDRASLPKIHADYNNVVREVARDQDVLLVDCAGDFERLPDKKVLFGHDGIHPNEAGHRLIARDIFLGLLRCGWISAGEYQQEDGGKEPPNAAGRDNSRHQP